MNEQTHSDLALPKGTKVDNYIIDKRLGGGGFSIVYRGHEIVPLDGATETTPEACEPESDAPPAVEGQAPAEKEADKPRQVIIKEYMPRKLATRGEDGRTVITREEGDTEHFNHGRKLFLQEASTLAKLKHPNIVNVINFFRANGTVYMVMAYAEGINLQDYIRRHKGQLSEKVIRSIFVQLAGGLRVIHNAGLMHLDLKPGNIFLRAGGRPLLLDFGAVHQQTQSRRDQPAQVITQGFSPIEQINPGGYVGPWTDIYALGATVRACLDGTSPPPANERRLEDKMKPATEAFRREYSHSLLAAIDWAMEVDPLHRPQNVDEFLEALNKEDPPEPPEEHKPTMLERIANSLPWNK